MSLSGSAWSADLFGILSGMGMTGPNLMDFTDAVGIGSTTHVVGKAFVTVDVGLTAGSGSGIGTGITGIVGATVASAIFSDAVAAFGQSGPSLQDICDAIGQALVTEMGSASLTSTHSPVFLGAGTITAGSITVSGSPWGSSVQSAAPSFIGPSWADFAGAIGTGSASGFSSATGSVVISGAPPPFPAPGGGSGSGTIS